MKLIIHGINGKMGQIVLEEAINNNILIDFGIGREDSKDLKCEVVTNYNKKPSKDSVCIDFSHNDGVLKICDYCLKNNIPLLVCTTGLEEKTIMKLKEASKNIPISISYNTSLGIMALKKLLKQSLMLLDEDYDIEIIEKHHRMKKDAPSGTCKMLIDVIDEIRNIDIANGRNGDRLKAKNEVGVHAVRTGGIFGEHSISLSSKEESITISHTAFSRNLFAKGAIKLAEKLSKKSKGFFNAEILMEGDYAKWSRKTY